MGVGLMHVLVVKGLHSKSSADENNLVFVTHAMHPAVENVLWHHCVYLDAMMIGLQSTHCTIQLLNCNVQAFCFHCSNVFAN